MQIIRLFHPILPNFFQRICWNFLQCDQYMFHKTWTPILHRGRFFSKFFKIFFPKKPSPSEWSKKIFFEIFFEWIIIALNLNGLFMQNLYMKSPFSFYFWLFSLLHWAWKIANIKKKTEWGPWNGQIQAHSDWDQYINQSA